jgi:hypothetical protein
MSPDKHEQLKMNFHHDWHCRCLCTTDDHVDIAVMGQKDDTDDHVWTSIQLPHIVDDKIELNWWYRKQFELKDHRQSSDERVILIFEPINDHNSSENGNNNPSIKTFIVWLNETQIFSGSFQLPRISIDLTESLVYLEKNDSKNTLVVCCTKASLSLHAYLLLSHEISDAIEQEHLYVGTTKTHRKSPCKQNYVLDDLINYDDVDGLLNIHFNSSPNISKKQSSLDIIVNEDCDDINKRKMDNKENIEEFEVPRLAIVMLIVGTRGDVQPFVA